ncbi:hypothetical protein BDU57DRAFT_579876 [Ampelomyces quisqualis]|uniref:RWD domain-containing protein n=1 Tax=Ampelomyces quisqualis TaxID=50730 RepID=A0A6A5QD25_AMPQU|nr:hypothetical protein BDU57DRAFT_579876 [Ampelomyces quisqualis]
MSDQEPSRLELEIELVIAMYPEQVDYNAKTRVLNFTQRGATVQLRLPESYPESGLPDVIAARDAGKSDVRARTKAAVKQLGLVGGEEALDAIIAAFQQLLESTLTKRKLALSPTTLSGITKPGYPGIMIFSGPSLAVTNHVNTLKAENWQAFQVRYEEDKLWEFAHGKGVKEVETMAEVVKGLELESAKEEFLKAVGIK